MEVGVHWVLTTQDAPLKSTLLERDGAYERICVFHITSALTVLFPLGDASSTLEAVLVGILTHSLPLSLILTPPRSLGPDWRTPDIAERIMVAQWDRIEANRASLLLEAAVMQTKKLSSLLTL